MIAVWMLYCAVMGMLLLGAGILAEKIVLDRGGATRRVWAWGLTGTLLLPLLSLLAKDGPAAVEVEGALAAVTPTSGVLMESVQSLSALDGSLLVLWGAVSVVLAMLLAFAAGATRWKGRAWTAEVVDGVPVLVSDRVGPAVIGVLRGTIVLPRWALRSDASERSMMLRHEQEHLAAGDPRLTLFAALLVVLVPWNPAVWFMAHRMRLAVEVDCDRRVVLGGDVDTRTYAELLLAVGTRRSSPAYGIGFSLGRPFLEQRIDRMTLPVGRGRWSRNLALALGVSAVLIVAWGLPHPVRAATVDSVWNACPGDSSDASRKLLGALQSTH